jgi:hypothetical protein
VVSDLLTTFLCRDGGKKMIMLVFGKQRENITGVYVWDSEPEFWEDYERSYSLRILCGVALPEVYLETSRPLLESEVRFVLLALVTRPGHIMSWTTFLDAYLDERDKQ